MKPPRMAACWPRSGAARCVAAVCPGCSQPPRWAAGTSMRQSTTTTRSGDGPCWCNTRGRAACAGAGQGLAGSAHGCCKPNKAVCTRPWMRTRWPRCPLSRQGPLLTATQLPSALLLPWRAGEDAQADAQADALAARWSAVWQAQRKGRLVQIRALLDGLPNRDRDGPLYRWHVQRLQPLQPLQPLLQRPSQAQPQPPPPSPDAQTP